MNTVAAPALRSKRTAPAAPDYANIKQRQQATWASGDFAVIGVTLQIVGESLAEAADIRAGERVLDVAAGNGNATLAAARRFAERHLDRLRAGPARKRPRARHWPRACRWISAWPTPKTCRSTTAVSTSRCRRSARCSRRITRGPRAKCCAWCAAAAASGWRTGRPKASSASCSRSSAATSPPPAGLKSPALWGTEAHIVELFGAQATAIRATRKHFNFRYRSAAHWIQVFRDFYGPTHKAFAALDPAGQEALAKDITALLDRCNIARILVAGGAERVPRSRDRAEMSAGRNNQMKIRPGDRKVDLARDQMLTIGNGPGTTVTCARGMLWLTQNNDRRDFFLSPGESFTVSRDGIALLLAMESSTVVVTAPGSRHAAWLRGLFSVFGRTNANQQGAT